MTFPPDPQSATDKAFEAALADLTQRYRKAWPPFRDALVLTYDCRQIFLRWAIAQYRGRQLRRAAERRRWRDRPLWFTGRLAATAAVLAVVASTIDLTLHGTFGDRIVVFAVTATWLLVHRAVRTAPRARVRRWARFTGRAWPLAVVLTAVIQIRMWPGGLLAGPSRLLGL